MSLCFFYAFSVRELYGTTKLFVDTTNTFVHHSPYKLKEADMTIKRTLPEPTDSELAILQELWRQGSCTVRDVYDVLSKTRSTGYTTTLKLMQIMAEKGLVTRDESHRTHVYTAAGERSSTQKQLVSSFLERAFEGSAKALIMQAISAKESSSEELAEIRELIDSLEGDKQ
jgi:BlaI family penicillinase repressor